MMAAEVLARWRESSRDLVTSLGRVAAQHESAASQMAATIGRSVSDDEPEPELSVHYSSYPSYPADSQPSLC